MKEKIRTWLKSITGEEAPVEMITKEQHGDYTSNLAFSLAKKRSISPWQAAQEIEAKIAKESKPPWIEKIEIKPPGFINFYLSKKWVAGQLYQILEQKEKFGSGKEGKGQKILVEFVSANPTGPLHIGNARGGPLGDIIANVLERRGYQVEREFYVNDTGKQVELFGESLLYWYLRKQGKKAKFPRLGYQGEYIKELAYSFQNPPVISAEYFAQEGVKKMIGEIKKDCLALGIKFDNFVYESEMVKEGKTAAAIKALMKTGQVKEKEGALWFLDYVLLRSDEQKTPTYFANDIAYHLDKKKRGYDRVINILGANSFGHIQKLEAALEALGIKKGWLQTILYQFVRLKHGEKIEKMSKRLGTYVTARQVLNEIPKDVFRFMMIEKAPQTHLDFDLELAKKQTEENPVFYLQYGYARCCSILRKINPEALKVKKSDCVFLVSEPEFALIKKLLAFPDVVKEVAEELTVHQITGYVYELSRAFHHFYERCRVIDEQCQEVKRARLALVFATQIVLKNVLDILGMQAREKM